MAPTIKRERASLTTRRNSAIYSSGSQSARPPPSAAPALLTKSKSASDVDWSGNCSNKYTITFSIRDYCGDNNLDIHSLTIVSSGTNSEIAIHGAIKTLIKQLPYDSTRSKMEFIIERVSDSSNTKENTSVTFISHLFVNGMWQPF